MGTNAPLRFGADKSRRRWLPSDVLYMRLLFFFDVVDEEDRETRASAFDAGGTSSSTRCGRVLCTAVDRYSPAVLQ